MPQALLLAGAAAGEFAGAAAGEASAHAVCIQCCWQEPPPARRQRMPLVCSAAGRSCRRRGASARRWLSSLRAGAAAGEAPAHSAGIHLYWQELPPARPQRTPLACIAAGRSCQWHGFGACRLHKLWLAGEAAGCEAPSHDAGSQCCWQERPPARHQRRPLACGVAGRSCRFRGID